MILANKTPPMVSNTKASRPMTMIRMVSKLSLIHISFHSTIAPASGVTFPLNIQFTMEQDGTPVPGAATQHTFHTSAENANIAFDTILAVTDAPSILTVTGLGGNFLYSDVGMSIYQIS